ncbi:unnamed protein product [Cylindrotheca closterium]|uniref:Uncharacterized protein n=1 Tax=Cylindrotheca closterium TaxID=2856 RepID=A0AAD2GBF4_9STRA|nr:unnamed protein product [Cylindrotheca closterium]
MFGDDSFTALTPSTSANHMPKGRGTSHSYNSGKRKTAKNPLVDAMRSASTKFSITEPHSDQAPEIPMRLLSHSIRTCLERSDSEMSVSLRFAIAEQGDQPLHSPMRRLSRSLRSDAPASAEFRADGCDRSLERQCNRSLSSSFSKE